MTPQQIDAMKLALEALEGFYEYGYDRQECFEHITAIKEALLEHAMQEVQRLGQEIEGIEYCTVYHCAGDCGQPHNQEEMSEFFAVQPEQEPVAIKCMKEWIEYLKRKSDFGQHMKIPSEMSAGTCWELALELEQFINTSPPQRKPLTEQEMFKIWLTVPAETEDRFAFARAIEAAHGIRENT